MKKNICNQLLSDNDLNIPNYNKVLIQNSENEIKIISKTPIYISDIATLLKNFNISILSSTNFEYENNYIYKLKINKLLNKEAIKIIKLALLNKIPLYCKLYILTYENLTLREINLVRAFIKYQKHLFYEFNEENLIATLIKYSFLTKTIIEYFKQRHTTKDLSLEKDIESKIKEITNEKENKILTFLYLIAKNSLRTNYFLNKETIAFKIATKNFKHLLFGIQPNIESFIYHNDFNGIHLRMSKISRGGIRYSNREDFREEIRDLMITQQAKNAIIIPEGAKGGFVIFSKDKDIKKYYSLFIDALLDLVDSDVDIVKWDGEDSYFVVAADRGTANLSDVANEIAIKRDFNLKDAFASGGKTGYSHKALGITAKGALTSANRHFLEIGKNIFKDKISVVGIGSMRGDVFGNGMLANKNFLLIAAISHNEIFIDPNPNPEVAYNERKRLFENSLAWSEYNKDLISKGGGVFKRDEIIKLSNEIKELINYDRDEIHPNELIKKLLTLKVDLLYFGGIGTYIKASDEMNINISDKANEDIRVDAKDIKAFAICEGANLALTNLARFEYALNGGKINLDSIDNSAGVNTSDYEVNLKIILNSLVDKNQINEKEKIEILQNVKDEVIEKVLENNYSQSLNISLDEIRIYKEKFIKILEILENTDFFKRRYFNIPKNNEIDLIIKDNKIIRPALAIVMLYSKIFMKKYLLKNEFEDYFIKFLFEYFPKNFDFKEEIFNHKLKKEIIATTITNHIIDNAGISFISDANEKDLFTKSLAYLILEELINANNLRKKANENYNILLKIEEVLKYATEWLIKEIDKEFNYNKFLSYKEEIISIFNLDSIEAFLNASELLKFLPSIIITHLNSNLNLKEIINLYKQTFNTFKINILLKNLNLYKPKSKLEKNLKDELEKMFEFFVISYVNELIKENKTNIEINNEIKEIIREIEEINKINLLELSHISNLLILKVLKI